MSILELREAAVDSTIPRHTIDLVLRPQDRYTNLAKSCKAQLEHLTALFDDLLRDVGIPFQLHGTINRAARLLLRKVHSKTETEEIRGVSRATGVSMYLLVAFNVVLDLLMHFWWCQDSERTGTATSHAPFPNTGLGHGSVASSDSPTRLHQQRKIRHGGPLF